MVSVKEHLQTLTGTKPEVIAAPHDKPKMCEAIVVAWSRCADQVTMNVASAPAISAELGVPFRSSERQQYIFRPAGSFQHTERP
ncbi:hypothetical protein KZJ38_11800 [Paraburkholderia edwinii]|uniref:Uncharacterized protein n=1 Tax=Paraburkholderia edwinii TaxID=2861782 RepID=A0ABX8UED0_9BURK|nr:hypothetical protein [Paraburkholderia edwinii]QYD67086.1 hypothetical protein KZJ38_11800 [Paraburkholderia edwinii]